MAVHWSSLRGLLIDLDGVVYTGSEPIAGSGDFLAAARRHGLPFLLVTNNSTTSPELVAARLARMGIHASAEEILTSAQAAAAYVRVQAPGARVQIVGEDGLRQAATEEGLRLVDNGELPDWVIAGLDRTFDYDKLTQATRAILAGARFVATNADALLPVEGGNVLPGAGTMVAAIQTASGVQAIVTGKPEPALFEHGLRRLGNLQAHQAVMIGDRLDTDVLGGQRAGLRTILVLTGVTTPQQVASLGLGDRTQTSIAQTPAPDAILPNLASAAALFDWQ